MKVRQLCRILFWIAAFLVIEFLLLEGLSSTILCIHRNFSLDNKPVYARYDPELGWANIPGLRLPDFFGPGIGITINSQGFRGPDTPTETSGFRIICSGDSFTFGYGVDDDHTWCSLLANFDRRLQSVNMGQGGYGIDQAYLWYLRDGAKLKHSLQIFAFVTLDFYRMQDGWFFDKAKPMLSLDKGRLVINHVPVPRSGLEQATARITDTISDLSTARLITSALYRLNFRLPDPGAHGSFEVALKIFEELARSNAESGSKLVLVYLPVEEDYSDHRLDHFRARLKLATERRGLVFIDLIDDFRTLPARTIDGLFIQKDQARPDTVGHYSVAGNKWVAATLYKRINPDIAISR